jgi:pantothenate kinase
METNLEQMVECVIATALALDSQPGRLLIAIAGPPASGKSTLASHVQRGFQQYGTDCGLVPMDGFHFDNALLERRGLLGRKGAPETFDVVGFTSIIEQLKAGEEVSVPHFNRSLDQVEHNAEIITASQRYVVVEGNYLFLKDEAWRPLLDMWSLGVFVKPSLGLIDSRLRQRWLENDMSEEEAEIRIKTNDLPNAQYVLENSDFEDALIVFE